MEKYIIIIITHRNINRTEHHSSCHITWSKRCQISSRKRIPLRLCFLHPLFHWFHQSMINQMLRHRWLHTFLRSTFHCFHCSRCSILHHNNFLITCHNNYHMLYHRYHWWPIHCSRFKLTRHNSLHIDRYRSYHT